MSMMSDVALAWRERLDRLAGKRQCALLPALVDDAALRGRPVRDELDRLFTISVGRRLTTTVMGDHPARQSLTDVFELGARQADELRPFLNAGDTVLEYGGGIGRIGRAVRPHVHELISVDSEPQTLDYGPRIAPGVDFKLPGDVPDAPAFDGAYSVAVFFHLSLDEQRNALEYVHRRLKPGGWFLIDLKLGQRTEALAGAGDGSIRSTSAEDFRALYEPMFTARRVSLFNSGFLLHKKTAQVEIAEGVDRRYTVNEASVVADVLEGEVVVVNLDTGAYYILQGTASVVWQLVAAGRTIPETVAALARRYDGDASAIERSVTSFVEQLEAESLLIPATAGAPPAPLDERTLSAGGAAFSEPVMFRYTDMQALIQMDPIREYDETGWPRRHVPPVPRG